MDLCVELQFHILSWIINVHLRSARKSLSVLINLAHHLEPRHGLGKPLLEKGHSLLSALSPS